MAGRVIEPWPVPIGPAQTANRRAESSPSRAASATAAVRDPRPSLVANVRHVPVDRVRTDNQLLGDLAIAQPLRDQPQHLAFASRQQPGRRLCVGWAIGSAVHRGRCAHRPDHATGITRPREVGAPLKRDQRRARDPRREAATQPVRNRPVPTPVNDHRGCLHQPQLVANVIR